MYILMTGSHRSVQGRKALPYLPVYNAHFFSPKIASKIRMRIIHGILLFGVVCLITIKTKKLNVLKHH